MKFFSAIPYNVKARDPFFDSLNGLAVESLRSSTPGFFRAGVFDTALWTKKVSVGDALPENASRLGGAAFRMLNLTADTADIAGFSVRFDTAPLRIRPRWRLSPGNAQMPGGGGSTLSPGTIPGALAYRVSGSETRR